MCRNRIFVFHGYFKKLWWFDDFVHLAHKCFWVHKNFWSKISVWHEYRSMQERAFNVIHMCNQAIRIDESTFRTSENLIRGVFLLSSLSFHQHSNNNDYWYVSIALVEPRACTPIQIPLICVIDKIGTGIQSLK